MFTSGACRRASRGPPGHDALDYLAELKEFEDRGEPRGPSSHSKKEGLDDIRNGRTITLEEYRRTRGAVRYQIRLSDRAAKDLDRLNHQYTTACHVRRLEELADAPFDPRLSSPLTNAGGLRKSRVGGWRIIFLVDEESTSLDVVTIQRRGQVYQRI